MITILNRIFPGDISRLIYDILVKSYINNIVMGKIYLLELMMEKFIMIHKVHLYYNLSYNNDHNIINGILTTISEKYIVKQLYEFKSIFINH